MWPIPWLLEVSPRFADFWFSLGPNAPYYWLGLQAVVLVSLELAFLLRFWHYLEGHTKFEGRWWPEDRYRLLMQELYDDQQKGKVLRYEAKVALRRYMYGDLQPVFKDKKYGGLFDL